MGQNRVVVYSNGIADFQRCYEIEKGAPRRISIPVRQDHLADVLGSFNVYGNVTLESPPTFRPSNELEGNISIDPQKVLEDLATNLSGAKVRLERPAGPVEGTLVGLHREAEATAGEPIHPKSIVVLADDGLRRCALRDIQAFEFLQEDVQNEIDKALQRNYQRIKPNSTFVELVISADQDAAEAMVQYTLPAAAWKISYRLRVVDGHATQLQGFAIVDNNTDEDWSDFSVCVVTGEPITFSTDLAQSKSPSRKHVDLVSETALGAVEVEAPAMMSMETIEEAQAAVDRGIMRKRSKSARRDEMGRMADYSSNQLMSTAGTTDAEVREVGDFSMFESVTPVTIPAKRSTVIPVFNVEVEDIRPVLHYKHENHPSRPYRSIDFTNRTDLSLGRGVCTVFQEGAYAGSCIMPALKPEENRLLPHALENGMSIHRDDKRERNKVVALRLLRGVCYTSTRQTRETHYHIKNNRDVESTLFLDHDYTLIEPDLEARLKTPAEKTAEQPVDKKLANGVRFQLPIGPHAECVLIVSEQRIADSRVQLVYVSDQVDNFQIKWIEQNLIKTNGPLAGDEGLQNCLQIHQKLEAKQQEIEDALKEIERLAERQERLRKNIKSGGQDELTSRWRSELDEAEQSIKRIEDQQIPALQNEERKLRTQMREALTGLAVEWSDS